METQYFNPFYALCQACPGQSRAQKGIVSFDCKCPGINDYSLVGGDRCKYDKTNLPSTNQFYKQIQENGDVIPFNQQADPPIVICNNESIVKSLPDGTKYCHRCNPIDQNINQYEFKANLGINICVCKNFDQGRDNEYNVQSLRCSDGSTNIYQPQTVNLMDMPFGPITDVKSQVLAYYLLDAIYKCSNKDMKGCQVLGNLCVLSWYNFDEQPCQKFKQLAPTSSSNNGWNRQTNYPHLLFQDKLTIENIWQGVQYEANLTFRESDVNETTPNKELIPIPVKVMQTRNNNIEQYVTRFTVFDNISGFVIDENLKDAELDKVKARLYQQKAALPKPNVQKIYIPYITISYEYVEILQNERIISNLQAYAEFNSYYNHDSQGFWPVAKAIFITLNVFIYRTVSLEWSLFWVGFFLTGLDWINLQHSQPNLQIVDVDVSEKNPVLRYFISCIVYLLTGIIQIIFRRMIIIWVPTQIQNFTDLCSVANISIFIMDEQLHGYYLHGKSASGCSEGNSNWLKQSLDREAKSSNSRGLIKGDNLQTFETFLPVDLRFEYNQEYKVQFDLVRAKYNTDQKILGKTVSREMIIEMEKYQFKDHITNVLKTYIKEMEIHHNNHVLIKGISQRLLKMPPTDGIQQGLPFFYKDPDMEYKSIFYCGNEWNILLFEMITYLFYDYLTKSTLQAIFITYVFSKFFSFIRDYFGKRNISEKTMVDERFLI
ncbi:transmembrane protein isoform cra_b, putative [Ichthyophthirius multifiliis]|uniref:Transmembrane protein isoform cra_b, putative n=1 Tax=Ichthyophthirius multifiliis TaxID=5932 RepID=G0QKG0_ICHMU|nr:transmembrane protein isoform cra_b, putative [Ichthyophthirius multifiliis]EGR34301.1 transmembrane protein isoform cra_b, putative [Ichthyophthirius multifiliis]|eukprot:XP_004039605.1 transmembrane protein isoform cra_b, putative [Ichthyophthirius multifiliis]